MLAIVIFNGQIERDWICSIELAQLLLKRRVFPGLGP
jgi:hypothetical protein